MSKGAIFVTNATIQGILIAAALSLILSCASPMKLSDNWKNSTHTGPAYRKIMVIAMTQKADMQRYFENEFVQQLKPEGVEAVACHELFPGSERQTREDVIRRGREKGIEAYLIARVLASGTEIQAYGSSDRTLDSMTYLPWFGPSPAMIKEREAVTMESRLYDGKTLNIVWRSTAAVVDPYGSPEQIAAYTKLVVNTMHDQKLIPGRWELR